MKKGIFFLLCLFSQNILAQSYYFIYLKDKQNSTYSLDRAQDFLSQKALNRRKKQNLSVRPLDLPVSPFYLQQIRQTGAKILLTSRWCNAALLYTDANTFLKVQELPFVKGKENLMAVLDKEESIEKYYIKEDASIIQKIEPFSYRTEEDYGDSFRQSTLLGIDKMHSAGFRGEGLTIALIDNGFLNADQNPSLQGINIGDTYDFTKQKKDVYYTGDHGAKVLSTLAANAPSKLIGAAYKATFALYKTEIDNILDEKIEEIYWILAAERADSIGADIITSSLGYIDFKGQTYQKTDLNGKNALITKAANWAAGTGMLVIKSAGNEGNTAWQTYTFPADADSVLTVGAVTSEGNKAVFSSFGKTADGRIKPDIAVLGQNVGISNPSGTISSANGTSFAAPVAAGLAAGLWQKFPQLTNMDVLNLLRRSGNRFHTPNDSIGYGIPHFDRAIQVVNGLEENKVLENQVLIFPNPSSEQIWTIYLTNQSWLNKPLKISFWDMVGRNIVQEESLGQEKLSLNLQHLKLSKGTYLLVVENADQKIRKKMIVD